MKPGQISENKAPYSGGRQTKNERMQQTNLEHSHPGKTSVKLRHVLSHDLPHFANNSTNQPTNRTTERESETNRRNRRKVVRRIKIANRKVSPVPWPAVTSLGFSPAPHFQCANHSSSASLRSVACRHTQPYFSNCGP